MCIESEKIQCESKRSSRSIESKKILRGESPKVQCESKRDSICIESKEDSRYALNLRRLNVNLSEILCALNLRLFNVILRRFNMNLRGFFAKTCNEISLCNWIFLPETLFP